MQTPILVLSRDQSFLVELGQNFDNQVQFVPCESLTVLHDRLRSQQVGAVLVHLDQATVNGYSPGRFIAELDEAVESAPLYGIVDDTCPPRLRKLAGKTIDDCLETPVDYPRLRRMLTGGQNVSSELEGFWQQLPHKELQGKSRSLVTFTPEMFEMMDELQVAARHNVTVLLIGETGSGKTFLAKLIHELSDRRDERFVTLACGTLPPDLIESELFGYVKGAFTGADRDREGKFAAAGGGTLLLDEIDVLPPEQQAKLLRVIETGEYEPVGSNDTQTSRARLIVASNYNLEELVRNGNFRTDLYYRLNILNFHLLPLRQRPWDIEYLVRKFALEHSKTHSIPLRSIDQSFFEALRAYNWPGNVREMENVVRRAVLYCQRGVLTVNDLPSPIRMAVQGHVSPTYAAADVPALPVPDDRYPPTNIAGSIPVGMGVRPRTPNVPPQMHRAGSGLPMPMPLPLPQQNMPTYAGSFVGAQPSLEPAGHAMSPLMSAAPVRVAANSSASASLEARVDVLERRIIEDALQRNNFRRKETAAELGISRVTLYNKMKKFGLL